VKNTWFYGNVGFGGRLKLLVGLEPPALPLATGLPQYKPYETDDSNNILNFFNTICIDPLPSSRTESYQSFITVRVYEPLV